MSSAGERDWQALVQWSIVTAGLALSAEQIAQLRAYVDVLLFWNHRLALVSQREPPVILAKHVADSLFAASRCGADDAVIDLGSGAGFPALPIAIARPTARVCLIESRGKKASFLEQACRSASISNASVRHARIESIADDPRERGRYSVATARALTDTAEFVALARPFLARGGRAIAMRAISAKSQGEPDGEEVRYTLPDGTPRRLLIIPQ